MMQMPASSCGNTADTIEHNTLTMSIKDDGSVSLEAEHHSTDMHVFVEVYDPAQMMLAYGGTLRRCKTDGAYLVFTTSLYKVSAHCPPVPNKQGLVRYLGFEGRKMWGVFFSVFIIKNDEYAPLMIFHA